MRHRHLKSTSVIFWGIFWNLDNNITHRLFVSIFKKMLKITEVDFNYRCLKCLKAEKKKRPQKKLEHSVGSTAFPVESSLCHRESNHSKVECLLAIIKSLSLSYFLFLISVCRFGERRVGHHYARFFLDHVFHMNTPRYFVQS